MYDIAIIGCGPVGALAANLLAKDGWHVLVVEKEANPYPLPRAVHLDHEMVRLFQSIGLHQTILADMRDTEGHLHVGADQGVLRYMGTSGKPRLFGWSNDYFFYQPELEEHLRQALSRFNHVTMLLGTELTDLTLHKDRVELSLLSDQTTKKTLSAQYVIACDGARSRVRKQLGIKLEDLDFEEPWLVVDAEVDGDVSFPDIANLPPDCDLQKLSVMMCDPDRPMTIVPGRGNHRRWEMMLLPGEDDVAMTAPEQVASLLSPWLNNVAHRIVRAATYRFHGLVAEQWQQGRVFLAGDAAHQTPPFFGQGMCHGFRDVANLAWKLNLVLQGKASSDQLTTYQEERDPHVRAIISAAVDAGRYICLLDKEEAVKRDTIIREKVSRNELPTSAGDLIPPIRSGLIAKDTPRAGARFIQPTLSKNGQSVLLDEVATSQWRIIGYHRALTDKARSILQSLAQEIDIEFFDLAELNSDILRGWFTHADISAVLLRPDHYVYGTATNDISTLLRSLQMQLLVPADNQTSSMEITL